MCINAFRARTHAHTRIHVYTRVESKKCWLFWSWVWVGAYQQYTFVFILISWLRLVTFWFTHSTFTPRSFVRFNDQMKYILNSIKMISVLHIWLFPKKFLYRDWRSELYAKLMHVVNIYAMLIRDATCRTSGRIKIFFKIICLIYTRLYNSLILSIVLNIVSPKWDSCEFVFFSFPSKHSSFFFLSFFFFFELLTGKWSVIYLEGNLNWLKNNIEFSRS